MSRPQCMVWGALAVVLLVSRAVGVAPLRLRRRPAGWLITFSPYVYAYNVIIVSVIVSAGVVGLVLDLNMEPSRAVRMRTPTKRILWIVDFGTVLLSALVGAYEGPYRMNNMIEYLNELRKINKNMNIQSSKERVRMAILLISYFGFILVMALDIWTTRSHADRLNRDQLISNLYLSFSYTYMTLILLQSQFTVGAMAVHSTLKNLNNALETQTDNEGAYKNICGNDDDGATFNGEKSVNVVRNKKYFTGHFTSEQSKKTRETVRHIALSFSNFCHIVTEVTKCHEISLLLLLVFYGIHLVITPYYVSLAIHRL
ncbi:uncharacterized protein LOC128199971 [Galleria mellonella]|uniref:Gustatory receptor n=1 Tax=Galleria mellonella TaxID=7137 RepID=A0ABM3MKE3_GALME|nr:uncharacterized protein LOC128199971 [Galleria mellonella]